MSFTPQSFNKKLESLLDTQDSIVSISQWVIFHHRHINEISKIWSDFILSAANNKILSLLYLCNDVVQQLKHKRKPELIKVFAGVLPEVIGGIMVKVDDGIKSKIIRLIEVWETRLVFLSSDLSLMKDAIDNPKVVNHDNSSSNSNSNINSNTNININTSDTIDNLVNGKDEESVEQPPKRVKISTTPPPSLPSMPSLPSIPKPSSNTNLSMSTSSQPNSHSSSFNSDSDSNVVPELTKLNELFIQLNKLVESSQSSLNELGIKSISLLPNDPSTIDLPSPPTYIKQLNELEISCKNGIANLSQVKNIRLNILENLKNLSTTVKEGLGTDDSKRGVIQSKLNRLYRTRNEVEGLPPDDIPSLFYDDSYSNNLNGNGTTSGTPSGYGSDDDDNDEFIAPTYDSDSESEHSDNTNISVSLPLKPKLPVKPPRSNSKKRVGGKSKKSVAFSDNIEIKEYDRDNSEVIKIIKSDDDYSDYSEPERSESERSEFELDTETEIEDNYSTSTKNEEYDPGTPSVLDLLSKLS